MQTKYDQIRDGNTKIRILHKISEIVVYKTSGHQILHHISPISWTIVATSATETQTNV